MTDDKLFQSILSAIPDGTKKKLTAIVENLNRHRQPGEGNLDLVKRLTGGNPTDLGALEAAVLPKNAQPEPVPHNPASAPPPSEPAPAKQDQAAAVPTYRFRTYPEMDNAMKAAGLTNWESTLSRGGAGPMGFASLYGVTPSDPRTQAEMHRVYASGSNEAWAAVTSPGPPLRTLTFNRLMIEPVQPV
jgi:hypothetical protein